MVMFKRYGQLLLEMPSLSEESTAGIIFHGELSSLVTAFLCILRHYRVTLDPQN